MNKQKNNYFYSELEDQIIVNSITSDFNKRKESRKQYELVWELNMNFYLGNQNSYISSIGEVGDIEKKYYWESNATYNHIAPVIESRLAKLNKVKPNLDVNPNSNSEQDISSAKLAKAILKSNLDANAIDSLISSATNWSEITGTVVYKLSWEDDLGNTIGTVENTPVKNGDVKITVCSPFEIYPDSNTTCELNDCLSIIHARAVPTSYIKDNWNIDIESEEIEVYELNNSSSNSSIVGSGNNPKIIHLKKDEQVILIERYEKPTKSNPCGRLTIVCGNKLLYDGQLPYKLGTNSTFDYPFVKQVSIKQMTSFWGTSVIERCIPIQRAYNAIKNKKHEYISRLTSGVLTVEDGSVDVDNLENEGLAPGKIIIYRNGSKAPEFLEEGSVPEELNEEEDKLLSELNNMCCVSDLTTNSSIPGNINSGSALTLLIEQDESRLSLTAEHIRCAVKDLGAKIIRMYKQFANKVRLNKIANSNGSLEVFYWTNNDLTSDDICFESKNELEESVETMRNNLITAYEKGLLSDKNGKISNSCKLKILELLGFSSWELPEDIDEIHQNKAAKENQQLINLEEPLEIDNHLIHIEEHTKFIILNNSNLLTTTFKNQLLEHINKHKKLLNKGE